MVPNFSRNDLNVVSTTPHLGGGGGQSSTAPCFLPFFPLPCLPHHHLGSSPFLLSPPPVCLHLPSATATPQHLSSALLQTESCHLSALQPICEVCGHDSVCRVSCLHIVTVHLFVFYAQQMLLLTPHLSPQGGFPLSYNAVARALLHLRLICDGRDHRAPGCSHCHSSALRTHTHAHTRVLAPLSSLNPPGKSRSSLFVVFSGSVFVWS